MSMVGTFDGFTAARLGIYAAQHGLRVTGNNVSNINTMGYTRQRVDQSSFKAGANDMYRSYYDNHIGSGALVTSISQLRDPYLDIRYRSASTDTYHYDTWLAGLQNIASILDEVGKGDNEDGLIYKQIQDLAEKLRSYSANPTTLNDRLVRNSAESLTALFHNAATRLEKLYNETVTEFNEDVSAVNEILTNIRDLNKSIREAEIHGDAGLEMRDERNRQIDALSQYLDIKVEYSFEDVGGGVQVEKLTIKLNDANPDNTVKSDESTLVDGVFATQLSVPKERPVLNTLANSGDLWYLQGYRYLKMVTRDELDKYKESLEAEYRENHPELGPDDEMPFTEVTAPISDSDGNQLYLIGTNDSDVDNIYTETNDNFTIQLGKLLNSKGEEWKKTTTAWTEVTSFKKIDYNTWTYDVKNELTAGGSFIIDGVTYNIVADDDVINEGSITETNQYVRISEIDDDAKFAKFVANKLKNREEYADKYTVTSKGNQIIFTAKTEGFDEDPKLKVEPDNAGITLSDPPEKGTATETVPADLENYPQYERDEHGRVTLTTELVQAGGRWYQLTISTEYTHEVTLDDNDLHGILQAQRELLTEEGEFASKKDVAIDESALIKRGIPYYMHSLDLLAQKFAESYNQLNTGYACNQDGYYIKEDGTVLEMLALQFDEDGADLKDDDGNPVYALEPVSIDGLTRGQYIYLFDMGYFDENGELDVNRWLRENGGWSMGGTLFSTLDGETTGIKASNISIASGWSNGDYGLVPTFRMLFADDESGGLTHSTKNDNADHMVALIDKDLTYDPTELKGLDSIGPVLFSGSFNDMLSNMMAVEGEDASITNVKLTTFATTLTELDYSREGVSGVDLNDEAMNMITYQKAMSAAMRVMTAIDEVLDRLINNTGIAGR